MPLAEARPPRLARPPPNSLISAVSWPIWFGGTTVSTTHAADGSVILGNAALARGALSAAASAAKSCHGCLRAASMSLYCTPVALARCASKSNRCSHISFSRFDLREDSERAVILPVASSSHSFLMHTASSATPARHFNALHHAHFLSILLNSSVGTARSSARSFSPGPQCPLCPLCPTCVLPPTLG